MVTYRQLAAIKHTLDNARDIATEPEIICALTEASDELAAAMSDIQQSELNMVDTANSLLAHVAGQMAVTS